MPLKRRKNETPHFIRDVVIGPEAMGRVMRPLTLRLFKYSRVSCVRNYHRPEHMHTWAEFIIPTSGVYSCTLNGTRLSVAAGELLIVQPGDRHSDDYRDGSAILFLMYDMRGVDGAIWPHGIYAKDVSISFRIVTLEGHRQLSAMLDIILTHTKKNRFLPLAVEKLGEAFFWEALAGIADRHLSRGLAAALDVSGFQQSVLDYFSGAVKKKLNVPALAAHLGMGKRSFENRFRRTFNASPVQAFNEYKVGIAVQMLEQGVGIPEVSDSLGFQDQFYFSTVFKRVMGFPPSKTSRRRFS